ncbi:hypothetical protein HHI36_017774 [Cryptolaemus montrouzieri]|uniref:UDP-N-acetylglucosamine transporter n=1 Tax=Cryptolaemus montrouzieri TaxID=559131 RepID=A0ABD2NNE1_9CUCU
MRSKMNPKVNERKSNALKYVSLVTLTLQNAVLGLSMRYSRTREGDLFLSSTAVFMSEVVKLVTCLGIVYIDSGGITKLLEALNNAIIKQPIDTLKVGVPSFLYVVQNTLLYVSASHLDAATYQVTYQLKIFTTAIFSVLILKRQLLATQWFSLVSLIGGIVLVQLAQDKAPAKVANGTEQNHVVGFLAAMGACVISGFAGVYFEKILKGSDVSVWMRNIQLSLLSIPIGIISCFVQDSSKIMEKGFFFGYDAFVVYLVILQATGGLLVALVVKYADNILKGFATSLAIIISCVASIYLFNFHLTVKFSLGALFVIFAIFLYGYQPKKKSSPPIAHKV